MARAGPGQEKMAMIRAIASTVVDWAESQALPDCLVASARLLENDKLRVRLSADGTIFSLYDKEHQREGVAAGGAANALLLYQDDGDAWDIPMD
ncbi:MAG: alpha-mannosidase [Chloroflexi bacterium]|nr:alpha-mannosidase [Chloroflexota bacterium]